MSGRIQDRSEGIPIKINMIWLSVGLAIGDWLLETLLHVYLLKEGTFVENLIPHDANEMWMRLIIIALIISVGVIAEMFLRRQRKLQLYTAHLNRLLSFLSEVNQVMSRKRDTQELFEAACRIAAGKGGFHSSWVGLLDDKTGMVEPKAYVNIDEDAINKFSISVDKECPNCDIVSKAIRNKKSYICNEIATSLCKSFCRRELLQHGAHAAAAFPLFQHEKVVGAFTVYATEPGFFEANETAVLEEAANDISFALDSIERENKLHERLDELERSRKATVQREFRIRELRDELEQLKAGIKDNET